MTQFMEFPSSESEEATVDLKDGCQGVYSFRLAKMQVFNWFTTCKS